MYIKQFFPKTKNIDFQVVFVASCTCWSPEFKHCRCTSGQENWQWCLGRCCEISNFIFARHANFKRATWNPICFTHGQVTPKRFNHLTSTQLDREVVTYWYVRGMHAVLCDVLGSNQQGYSTHTFPFILLLILFWSRMFGRYAECERLFCKHLARESLCFQQPERKTMRRKPSHKRRKNQKLACLTRKMRKPLNCFITCFFKMFIFAP